MEKIDCNLPDRVQGELEGGFYWQDELVFAQCDQNLQVRMSALLEHLVHSATQHCRCYGLTYESLRTEDIAFVLTRVSLTIHKLPHCFQFLTLKTWMDGTKGPYYQRVTQWIDAEGEVLVDGRSDWVIIAPSTRSLVKPDKNDLRFQKNSPVSLPPCQRVKFDEEILEHLGEHQVKWSQMDGNGHMHSSDYGDIMWDFLPSSLQDKKVQSFHMEYQKECFLGDVIVMAGCALEDNSYIIQGKCDGQASFKGKIIFQ